MDLRWKHDGWDSSDKLNEKLDMFVPLHWNALKLLYRPVSGCVLCTYIYRLLETFKGSAFQSHILEIYWEKSFLIGVLFSQIIVPDNAVVAKLAKL